MDQAEISTISDEDLYQYLKRLGCNPGPILPSTRRLYEQKLYTLMNSFNEPRNKSHSSFNSSSNYGSGELHHRHRQTYETETNQRFSSPITDQLPEPATQQSSTRGVTVKLLLCLLLVAIIYLIYNSMESLHKNPIPQINS